MLERQCRYAGLRSHLHADYEGGGAMTLHPVFASYAPEEDTCLPLAVAGPAVEAARAELRAARVAASAAAPRWPGRLFATRRG